MSTLPSISGEGRAVRIALLAILALGQALSAGIAAFATRDVFAAIRTELAILPVVGLALIAGAGLAIAILRYAERVSAERIGQNYAASVRMRLFKHLTKVSSRDINKRRSGGLSMRFVGDLAAVRGWVSVGISRLVSASIVLPISGAVLFLLNPKLGFAAGIPIILGLFAMMLVGPRLGPAHRRLRARRARLAADMIERIPHAPELHLLGRINTETKHLIKRTDQLVTSAVERTRGAALLRAIPDAIAGLAAAMVLYTAVAAGIPGPETAGALAAVGLMIQPMRDLAGVWDKHRAWTTARDKCEALLSVPRLPRKRRKDQETLSDAPQSLSLQNVTADPLGDITITAEAGRKIAIVGANGAGKSTMLTLAAGLEQPAMGKVLFGDRPLMSLTTAERRNAISLVGSRSPILSGTLRRALTMGSSTRPDDEDILEAVETFGLSNVVDRLGGLDGKVAEAGRNLSAGEARRLLLTRAALSKPQLLLLDEPDDALDTDGPDLVERFVRGTDATTLMITHNMELAEKMDEIWLVADGRIVELGSEENSPPPETELESALT